MDGRSDVYAVGCVLYEMLVGEPPYTGPTAQAITARKLTEPVPNLRTVRETIPVAVEGVVRKALARAPADRYATAQQLIDALGLARTPVPGTEVAGVVPRPADMRWKVLAGMATAIAAACLVFWGPWRSRAESPGGRVYRLSVPILPLAVSEHGAASQVALSPDGTRLAYVSGEGGTGQLYVRALAGSEAVPVNGASNVQGPFFSPDGEWLGFASGDTLKKVRLSDGSVVALCRAGWLHGATWGPDGTIVFSGVLQGLIGIGSVPANGGTPKVLLLPDSSRNEAYVLYPAFLPDGKAVLVTGAGPGGVAQDVSLLTLATGERRVLVKGGGNATYLASGHVVYGQDGALFAVRFDAGKRELTGKPIRVVPSVLMNLPMEPALAHFSVSLDGTLVYLSAGPGNANSPPDLAWVTPPGAVDTIPGFRGAMERADVGVIAGPRISPDAGRLLFWGYVRGSEGGGSGALSNEWVYDLKRRSLTKLSVEHATWFFSIWTPDGRSVVAAVADSATTRTRLLRQRADGVGPAEALTTSEGASYQQAYSISKDGRLLLFHESSLSQKSDIYVLDMSGGAPRPVLNGPAAESHPALSPDGRWLAYASDQLGHQEIYVTDFPAHSGRWQVSTGGGIAPAWSPDGSELYFQLTQFTNVALAAQIMMVAEFDGRGAAPNLGTPVEVLRGPFQLSNEYGRDYDVAPDGRRFLMVRRGQLDAPLDALTVIVNWFAESATRLPGTSRGSGGAQGGVIRPQPRDRVRKRLARRTDVVAEIRLRVARRRSPVV